ncbi:MAG: hypothetical protein V1725_05735 [archaeon]
MKTALLITLGLVTLAAAQDPVLRYKRPYRAHTETVETLHLNTDSKHIQVAKKSEQDGLADIRAAVRPNKNETFMYLPEKQEWQELGIREYFAGYDYLQFIAQSRKEDTVHVYVINATPLATAQDTVSAALPTALNILDAIDMSISAPNTFLTYNIVSPLGITRLHITPEGKKAYKTRDLVYTVNALAEQFQRTDCSKITYVEGACQCISNAYFTATFLH